jgi:hypothetical protein
MCASASLFFNYIYFHVQEWDYQKLSSKYLNKFPIIKDSAPNNLSLDFQKSN